MEDYSTSNCKLRPKSTEAKSPVRENKAKSLVKMLKLKKSGLFGKKWPQSKIHTSRLSDNGRKMSPGSPLEIRDMAAFLEKLVAFLFYLFQHGCDFNNEAKFRFFDKIQNSINYLPMLRRPIIKTFFYVKPAAIRFAFQLFFFVLFDEINATTCFI